MKFKDKTRGGFPVRIYATDAGGKYCIHGAYFYGGEWAMTTWASDGDSGSEESGIDLIPLREPSEAALEAAKAAFWGTPSPDADMRNALRAAYEIDFPEGGK